MNKVYEFKIKLKSHKTEDDYWYPIFQFNTASELLNHPIIVNYRYIYWKCDCSDYFMFRRFWMDSNFLMISFHYRNSEIDAKPYVMDHVIGYVLPEVVKAINDELSINSPKYMNTGENRDEIPSWFASYEDPKEAD